jgi:hypothetical protein
MASKQGGKGKQSSPSRKASHLRARTSSESRRDKRIARHARRMGKTIKDLTASGALLPHPAFPRKRETRKVESVVFSGQVKRQDGLPLHTLIVNGVLLEISPSAGPVADSLAKLHPGMGFTHGILNPLTGKTTFVASRRCW